MEKQGFHCNVKGGELKKLKKKWVVFDKQTISIQVYPKSSASAAELTLPYFDCQMRMITVEDLKSNGIKEKEKDLTFALVYKNDNYIFNFEHKEDVEHWFNAIYAVNNVIPTITTTTPTTSTSTITNNESSDKVREHTKKKDKDKSKVETTKNKEEDKKTLTEQHSSSSSSSSATIDTPRKNSLSVESPRKSSSTESPRKNSTENKKLESPRKSSASDSPRKNSSGNVASIESPAKSTSTASIESPRKNTNSVVIESPRKNSKSVKVVIDPPNSHEGGTLNDTTDTNTNASSSSSKKKLRRLSVNYSLPITETPSKEEVISPKKHKEKGGKANESTEHKKEKASKKDKKKEDVSATSTTTTTEKPSKKDKKDKKIKVVKFAQDSSSSSNSSTNDANSKNNNKESLRVSSSSSFDSSSNSSFSPSSSVSSVGSNSSVSEDKVVYHVIKDSDKKSKRKSINLVFTKTSKTDLLEDIKPLSSAKTSQQQQQLSSNSLYVPIQQDLASLSPESRRRRSASVPYPVEQPISTNNKTESTQIDTMKKKRMEFVLNKLNEPTNIKKTNRPALMQTVSVGVMGKHSRPALLRRGSLDDIFEENKTESSSNSKGGEAVGIPAAVEEILSMKWDDFAKSLPRRVKHHTYYKDLAKNNKRILEDGQTIINAFKLFQKPEEIPIDDTPPPPPPPLPLPSNNINISNNSKEDNNNNNDNEATAIKEESKANASEQTSIKFIAPSEISFKDLLAKKFADRPIVEEATVEEPAVEVVPTAPPPPPPLPPKAAELRVNMLSYGNNEIEYEEMFGITKDGLNIWIINVELPSKVEAVLPRNYGIFYENDCYLVLNVPKEGEINKKSTDKTHNLHIWVGSKSSVDKRAISAIRAVELNKYMNDKGIHFREEQGVETDLFLGYFPYGIAIEEGGSENKFRNYAEVSVVSSRAEQLDSPLLYTIVWRVKEKKLTNIIQVERKLESLNRSNVFLLDGGDRIFLWKGDKVDNVLYFLCLGIASHINITYRSSEAKVIDLSDNQDLNLLIDFWDYFNVDYNAEAINLLNENSEYNDFNENLFKLVQEEGINKYKLDLVPSTNIGNTKSSLLHEHCYILDTVSQLFIWIGNKSNFKERKSIRNYASEIMKTREEEGVKCQLYIENEGSESIFFKAKFIDWPSDTLKLLEARSKNIQPSYTGKLAQEKSRGVNISDIVNAQEDIENISSVTAQEEELEQTLVKNVESKGTAELWILDNIIGPQFSKWPVEEKHHFYSEDAWMLLYTYYDSSDKQKYMTYFWEGQDCSSKWWASWSAGFFPSLEKKIVLSGGDPPTKERITQWKETKRFGKLFDSIFVVHKGKYKQHQKQPKLTSLFQISTISGISRAIEIDLNSDLLNSKYIYLLLDNNLKNLFIWNGKLSSVEDKEVSLKFTKLFEAKPIVLEEEKESEEFWNLFPYKSTKYLSEEFHSKYCKPIRLYKCSTLSGDFTIDKVLNFTQADLNNEESFFLDTYYELYLWVGQNSSESEKNLTQKAVKEYHTLISDKRNIQIPFLIISPETTILEPVEFTRHFPAWNIKQNSLDPRQRTYLRYLERQKEEELELLKQQQEQEQNLLKQEEHQQQEHQQEEEEADKQEETEQDEEEDKESQVIIIEVESDSEIPTEAELLEQLEHLDSEEDNSSESNSPSLSNRNSLDISESYTPSPNIVSLEIPDLGPPVMYLHYSNSILDYYLALQHIEEVVPNDIADTLTPTQHVHRQEQAKLEQGEENVVESLTKELEQKQEVGVESSTQEGQEQAILELQEEKAVENSTQELVESSQLEESYTPTQKEPEEEAQTPKEEEPRTNMEEVKQPTESEEDKVEIIEEEIENSNNDKVGTTEPENATENATTPPISSPLSSPLQAKKKKKNNKNNRRKKR